MGQAVGQQAAVTGAWLSFHAEEGQNVRVGVKAGGERGAVEAVQALLLVGLGKRRTEGQALAFGGVGGGVGSVLQLAHGAAGRQVEPVEIADLQRRQARLQARGIGKGIGRPAHPAAQTHVAQGVHAGRLQRGEEIVCAPAISANRDDLSQHRRRPPGDSACVR